MFENDELPDIHKRRPEIRVSISKVGVASVKMPVGYLSFEDKPVIVVPKFDAYIDVPMSVKGMHASRNYEVIMSVLREQMSSRYKLEDVCALIVKELLAKHEYASKAEVKASGEVVFERSTPITKIKTYETCDIFAQAIGERLQNSMRITRRIGVGLVGITTCPCAQEVLRDLIENELSNKLDISSKDLKLIFDNIPLGTHFQRAYGSLIMDVPQGFNIDAKTLVDIVERSMSAPTYGLLKRIDEAEVTKNALLNPRFAEDCVRYMAKNFVDTFANLPDNIVVSFSVKSYESIHKHDFIAEINASLGEIRGQLNGG
jgi:GTP cyclohydrolase-4